MKRRWIFFSILLLFCSFVSGQNVPGEDFNEYVLQVLKKYPTNGTHRYYWPKGGNWAGNTQDLFYRGSLFSKGDPQKRCYCCGLTFEVFLEAYESYCQAKGWPFVIKDFSSADLRKLRGQWFGSDGNKKTLLNAVTKNKLGTGISLEQAKPGDFVQLWRHSGSGHSVIFISWLRDNEQKIIGIQYWSTQKSTNGVGYNTEYINGSSVDKKQLYIARVGLKQNK